MQHSEGRGRGDLCEFEVSLVYRMSFRTARAIHKPLSREERERERAPWATSKLGLVVYRG